jgi:hypothetical protein
MFFRCLGLLEAAESHSDWVHRYRTRVYYRTRGLATYRDLLDPDLVKIKVVRNPYDRAVSAYIHAMKYPLEEICSLTGKTVPNLTFREFLELLCRLDLSICNPIIARVPLAPPVLPQSTGTARGTRRFAIAAWATRTRGAPAAGRW